MHHGVVVGLVLVGMELVPVETDSADGGIGARTVLDVAVGSGNGFTSTGAVTVPVAFAEGSNGSAVFAITAAEICGRPLNTSEFNIIAYVVRKLINV